MENGKINEIARLENILPTKKVVELEVNKKFQITEFKSMKTRYGQKTTAALDNEFMIFLPSRISTYLLEEVAEFKKHETLAADNRLFIRFLGGKWNTCEFIYE